MNQIYFNAYFVEIQAQKCGPRSPNCLLSLHPLQSGARWRSGYTYWPPTNQVGGSNPGPYVGKFVVAY